MKNDGLIFGGALLALGIGIYLFSGKGRTVPGTSIIQNTEKVVDPVKQKAYSEKFDKLLIPYEPNSDKVIVPVSTTEINKTDTARVVTVVDTNKVAPKPVPVTTYIPEANPVYKTVEPVQIEKVATQVAIPKPVAYTPVANPVYATVEPVQVVKVAEPIVTKEIIYTPTINPVYKAIEPVEIEKVTQPVSTITYSSKLATKELIYF